MASLNGHYDLVFQDPALTGALAEVISREAFYESTPSLHPLSYKDLVRSWSNALLKTYDPEDRASSAKAYREFEEHETDIVNIVGKEVYQRILGEYQRIISERLMNENISGTHADEVSHNI